MATAIAALWCRAGCSVKAVAASLAFYPPQPATYELKRRAENRDSLAVTSGSSSAAPSSWLSECKLRNDYELSLEPGVSFVPYDHVYVTEVITKRGQKIPVFSFGFPGAHFTLLYSHGNAVDLGLLRDVLIDLAINLRVNVVAYDYTGYGTSSHVGKPGAKSPSGLAALLTAITGRKRIQARPEARQAAAARKETRGLRGTLKRLRAAVSRKRDADSGADSSDGAASGVAGSVNKPARRRGSVAAERTASSETREKPSQATQPPAAQAAGQAAGPGGAPAASGAGARRLLPSESDVYADADAVAEWLLTTPFCASPDRVILYGQSLGSGPSVHLACSRPAAGLILHAGIASAMRVVTDSRALACLDIFDNVGRLGGGRLVAPSVLVMHGQRDEEVPVAHGHALAAAITTSSTPSSPVAVSTWYPPLAGHNDLPNMYRAEYYRRLRAFIAGLCAPTPPPAAPGSAAASTATVGPLDDYRRAPVVHPHQLGAVGRRLGTPGGAVSLDMVPPRPGGAVALTGAPLAAITTPADGASAARSLSVQQQQQQRIAGAVASQAYEYPYSGSNSEILPPGQEARIAPPPVVVSVAAPRPPSSLRTGHAPVPVSSAGASGSGPTPPGGSTGAPLPAAPPSTQAPSERKAMQAMPRAGGTGGSGPGRPRGLLAASGKVAGGPGHADKAAATAT